MLSNMNQIPQFRKGLGLRNSRPLYVLNESEQYEIDDLKSKNKFRRKSIIKRF